MKHSCPLKHIYFTVILTMLICLCCAPTASAEGADIPINAENFSDANFLSWCLMQPWGEDGVLTAGEASSVTTIDVTGQAISSLDGLEHFTSLEMLCCSNSMLSALDASSNTALIYIDCSMNYIESLNITGLTKLKHLYCNRNLIAALNTASNIALEVLSCNNNPLSSLDLSSNINLTELDSSQCRLSYLYLINNTALNTLNCAENPLTWLDLSDESAMSMVNLENQAVVITEITEAEGVRYFDLANVMPEANFGKVSNVNGGTFDAETGRITLNEGRSTVTYDYTANIYYTITATLGKPKSPLINIDEEHFPDANFRAWCLSRVWGESGVLTDVDAELIKDINVCYLGIENLDGLENFTFLETLDCSNNKLADLDISPLTALTSIDCSSSTIESLNTSANKALTILKCSDNPLSILDVSSNTSLTELDCSNCKLTELDLTNNTSLSYLYSGNNSLTRLDLPEELYSYDIFTSGQAPAELEIHEEEGVRYFSLVEIMPESKFANVLNVTGGTYDPSTGRITLDEGSSTAAYYYRANSLHTLSAGLRKPAIIIAEIDNVHFPDDNFRGWCLMQSWGEDGALTDQEAESITDINISYSEIESLEGIEYFTFIEMLLCDGNKLTELNVSENTELMYLDCSINSIEELDISANTKLTTASCYDNKIKELTLPASATLNTLYCYDNSLSTLDVTNNTGLWTLSCGYCQLSKLDLSNNTELTQIDCANNTLTWLDLPYGISGIDITLDNQSAYVLGAHNAEGAEYFDLADIMPAENFENVSIVSGGTYDSATGRITLEEGCYETTYAYRANDNYTILVDLRKPETIIAEIDAEHFPDDNFRAWCLNQSWGEDGMLSDVEIASITEIDVSHNGISRLDGIGLFTSVQILNCSSNYLTDLNLSANTELTELNYSNNEITTIDLSNNNSLQSLNCSSNSIGALDISALAAQLPDLKKLNCSNNQITELALSNISSLTALDCSINPLSTLDVSANASLEVLYCSACNLAELDLANNIALTDLDCHENILEELSVSALTELQYLNCSVNNLAELNLENNTELIELNYNQNTVHSISFSNNSKLKKLDCSENAVEVLDTQLLSAQLTELSHLYCGNNLLTELDLSPMTNLVVLHCNNNPISTLNVSNNSHLEELLCNGCKLTALDLTSNQHMDKLDCSFNSLARLDLHAEFTSSDIQIYNQAMAILELHEAEGARYFDLTDIMTPDKFVNISNATNGTFDSATGQLTLDEGSESVAYNYMANSSNILYAGITMPETVIAEIDETHFPDDNFRAWCLMQTWGEDGALTETEAENIANICVCNSEIASLEGIEYFTSLESLYCFGNQLTELDVSANTALMYLDCMNNKIENLNITALTELTTIDCSNNKLTGLNLSSNTSLNELNISNNPMVTLDVKNNTNLEILNCLKCALTELDLSGNTSLTSLDCSYNSLTWLDLPSEFISQDVEIGSQEPKILETYVAEGARYFDLINIMPTDKFANVTDVTGGTYDSETGRVTLDKGSMSVSYIYKANDYYTLYASLSRTELILVEIDEAHFPDYKFRNWCLSRPWGSDGKLSDVEVEGITEINVSDYGIESLEGIEYFTSLEELSCDENDLAALDISANIALRDLDCGNNSLDELNVSALAALEELRCDNNSLTALDLSGNTALTVLNYFDNEIKTIDLSNNDKITLLDCCLNSIETSGMATIISQLPALAELYCYGNALTELNLSALPDLRMLSCGDNPLDALDVSNNTNLEELQCGNCRFTELDLSNNEKLVYVYCADNSITELNISNLTDLEILIIGGNNISELDLSDALSLETLVCRGNELKALDVSMLTELTEVFCNANPLAWINLPDMFYGEDNLSLDNPTLVEIAIREAEGVRYFDLHDIMPEENFINITNVTDGTFDSATGRITLEENSTTAAYEYKANEYSTLSVNLSKPGIVVTEIDEAHFPDDNFRAWCLAQSWGSDKKLKDIEVAGINYMDINHLDLESIVGIEYFTSIKALFCFGNRLTELDVSKNTALTILSCEENEIEALDVSALTELQRLLCFDNKLTALDLSANSELVMLNYNQNNITTIDLSNNANLETLDCSYNSIETLDTAELAAQLPKLKALICSNNEITELDVSLMTNLTYLFCSNNKLKSLDASMLTKLEGIYCKNNYLTRLELPNQSALREIEISGQNKVTLEMHESEGARYFDLAEVMPAEKFINVSNVYGGTYDSATGRITLDEGSVSTTYAYKANNDYTLYAGLRMPESIVVNIDEAHFPDDNFRAWCQMNSWGADGVLTDAEIERTNEINIGDKEIASLTGIEYFTSLKILQCLNNLLTEIDVSANTKLTYLDCSYNSLSELDISANSKLAMLNCRSNQITELNLSNATDLETLICSGNKLTELDITGPNNLQNVFCDKNFLTWLDMSDFFGTNISIYPQNTCEVTIDEIGAKRYIFLIDIMPESCFAKVNSVTGGTYDASIGRITVDDSAETVTYQYDTGYETMYVTLHCNDELSVIAINLPSSIIEIEAEAFMNCAFKGIRLPGDCKTIGERAFKNCSYLKEIHIPASVDSIADDAFMGCPRLTIYCPDNSPAKEYAERLEIPWVIE